MIYAAMACRDRLEEVITVMMFYTFGHLTMLRSALITLPALYKLLLPSSSLTYLSKPSHKVSANRYFSVSCLVYLTPVAR